MTQDALVSDWERHVYDYYGTRYFIDNVFLGLILIVSVEKSYYDVNVNGDVVKSSGEPLGSTGSGIRFIDLSWRFRNKKTSVKEGHLCQNSTAKRSDVCKCEQVS